MFKIKIPVNKILGGVTYAAGICAAVAVDEAIVNSYQPESKAEKVIRDIGRTSVTIGIGLATGMAVREVVETTECLNFEVCFGKDELADLKDSIVDAAVNTDESQKINISEI